MRASACAMTLALLAAGSAGAAPADPPKEPAGRVVLRWQPVAGAAGYDLQVSTDPGFARRDVETRIPLPGFRLGAPPEVRTYWRVRSVDADGRPGPWSSTKSVEPLVRAPEPVAEPEPPVLDVSVPLAEAIPPEAPDASRPGGLGVPSLEPPTGLGAVPEDSVEGGSIWEVLRDVRPGVWLGWRHNLLAVHSPVVALDATWRLPWLGAGWGGSLRLGWWGDRSEIPAGPWLAAPVPAKADVFPITVLVTRSFDTRWARLHAGGGGGADLVVVRVGPRGALEPSAALVLVAGAGRPLGPGEAFVELQGALGGVDGPLGALRTGGLSASLGYRLGR